jgi:predicted metal-dependent enzyme (double-stranded beta helix superfamily)
MSAVADPSAATGRHRRSLALVPSTLELPTVSLIAVSSHHPPSDPSVRPSGRALHPSNQDRVQILDDDGSGALPFESLRAIATGFAQVQPPVPLVDDDPTVPRSVRLLATASYDVWLITWPDGSGLEPHDHGGVRSVLHVVDGEMVEIVADHVDRRPPRARILRRGDTVGEKPSFIHDLANRSGADATTLHVYSPPLTEISFFTLRSDSDCERLRTTAVHDQVPHASSNDLAPRRPPPLSLVAI